MPTCAKCKKRIRGEYIQALDKSWHKECFCCAACHKPIIDGSFYQRRGRTYHPNCYQERFALQCAACGEAINGRYIKIKSKVWHPEHFNCVVCGEPLQDTYYLKRGKLYCRQHYVELFAEKCILCGRPLDGNYLVDGWGNKYCKLHENAPRCSSCGRIISRQLTGGGVRYDDGRMMCSICKKDAVDDVARARQVLLSVLKVLRTYGIRIDLSKTELSLMPIKELHHLKPRKMRDENSAGLTLTAINTLNGRETNRCVTRIAVLTGLPEMYLATILAHEVGHAWMFTNRFPSLPRKVEEGICELFSYMLLKDNTSPEALYRIQSIKKNPDRVYGSGFRSAKGAFDKYGFKYLIDFVRKEGKFPK
jgi:hypothetical protein